jgi:hypothetical protein
MPNPTAVFLTAFVAAAARADGPPTAKAFFDAHCISCHDAAGKAGRLDLTALQAKFDDPATAKVWVRVHDRVKAGEMPPKDADQPKVSERDRFVRDLSAGLVAAEEKRVAAEGRATRRRMNRQEYEYAVRDLLGLPWLPLREMLPEDQVAHGYNTVGDALDVSHVQIARYLQAAEFALNAAAANPAKEPRRLSRRYYARDQGSFTRKFLFNQFNTAPERATFPVLGTKGQPDVRAGKAPLTVGAADPKTRELEGVGLVQGAYEPVEPKFNQFKAPASGRYKLRIQAHSVWVGPNGSNANLKNPQKKNPQWFVPNLDDVRPGRRSEPVAVYAERPPRQLRRLGAFDATPEPQARELDVYLLAGETIRPDAARLFRSRPGETRWRNPLAEKDGQPGVVYRWLDVEGPLHDSWPPPSHELLFDDLPVRNGAVVSDDPSADAKRLLRRFAARAYRRPLPASELDRFLPLVQQRLAEGASFKDAMLTGYTAVLCSPEFLTLHMEPGRLDDHALAARLAFFLWNSEPDAELRSLAAKGELGKSDVLRRQTQRLLDDPKSRRFVVSFLDYWLDLRKITDNSPDAGLYGDYYLDDLLVDSALEETRLYFAEMLRANLPARAVAASDFAFVNERLADHYGLRNVEGVALRKVKLPKESVRGGLLTQASVLTVTANGTTTSPVIRGAWVMDRILGTPPQPPPPVPAVEPDLRGAVTIREQLAKHRDQRSCAACHDQIDPPGFALESFDVMGGYRRRYRALAAEKPQRTVGWGFGGQPFQHRDALPVDCTGELPGAGPFKDVRELKAMLVANERQLARNLVKQLIVYATGAPVAFRDRTTVERILDDTMQSGYRTADLIHALVQSDLFRHK